MACSRANVTLLPYLCRCITFCAAAGRPLQGALTFIYLLRALASRLTNLKIILFSVGHNNSFNIDLELQGDCSESRHIWLAP